MLRRVCLILLAYLLAGCARAPQEIVLSGPTMGTTYTVRVARTPEHVDGVVLRQAIDEVLARIDREMSTYRGDSAISRFNASRSTDWVGAAADLAEIVTIAQSVSMASGGVFDVTVGPLVAAWGFGAQRGSIRVPDDATLAAIRPRVGHEKLHARRDPPALRKDAPELAVDLNGIAPGFAVDLLAARFRAMQLEHFMIDVGGEIRARGRNARGEPWRIAVERPIDAEPTPYAIVQLHDMAVTTSGEYRRYYMRDGRRYSHTIDPRTGRPVEHELASVVVIGASAAHVDAWATAYNVLGAEAGYELAAKLGMAVMFIERRGDVLAHRMTPQFEPYVVFTEGRE